MWIKICGIREAETARRIAELCPQAVGLNFYTKSVRSVDVPTARTIIESLPQSVEPVGVFVNQSVQDILAIIQRCGLRQVQLHGEESPADLAALQSALPKVRLIRAWRVGDEGLSGLRVYLQECRGRNVVLSACLIDARVEGVYGGTGRTAPWDVVADEYRRDEWPPLILAGGLTPSNVASAISTVRPWGVDVAGGVESSPGIMEIELVRTFIDAAGRAFQTIKQLEQN